MGTQAWRRGRFLPPALSTPGFNTAWTNPDYKKGITGGASLTLDPTQQALRESYTGLTNQGIGMMNAAPTNVGGYGAISPELYQEFLQSNEGADPTAFYDQAGFDSLLGGNLNLAQLANQDAASILAGGTQGNMEKWLGIMRELARGEENNLLQGNFDKQFARGVLGSTAGSYQTEGITNALTSADLQRQLQAYGMSQDEINQALARAASTTGVYSGMEGDAASRQFDVNNAINNRTAERFARAAGLFGMGMNQQNVDFTRGQQMFGTGASALSAQDAQIQNMLNTMFGGGAMQSSANNQAVANRVAAQAGSQNMMGMLMGGAMQGAGSAFGGYYQGAGATAPKVGG